MPPGYAYSDTPVPTALLFHVDANAKDIIHDKDFNLGLLTDEEKSTG